MRQRWRKVSDEELENDPTPEGMRTTRYGSVKVHHGLNITDEELDRNIRENVASGRPQIPIGEPQDTVLAICLGGPSLVEYFDEIKRVQDEGGKVVAGANTARTLVDAGIRPNCHVLLDGNESNRDFLVPNLDCTYLIGSQCHPSVLKSLEWSDSVYLWHGINAGKNKTLIELYPDGWLPIRGGGTLGTRIFNLFSTLGYHRFEVFGFDSCAMDGKHHAYEQPKADGHDYIQVEMHGKKFWVAPWMFVQAEEFKHLTQRLGQNWEMIVHGDGLIATMVRGE